MARVEKGEGIPNKMAPKSYFLCLSRTTIEPSIWIRGPNWLHEKLKLADGFRHPLQIQTSPETKPKLNESRQPKFYPVRQLKENSTENSAGKNLKKDSQLNELWNVSIKKKKEKKNTQIQRILLCFHYN